VEVEGDAVAAGEARVTTGSSRKVHTRCRKSRASNSR
jgi:hypothetical protein